MNVARRPSTTMVPPWRTLRRAPAASLLVCLIALLLGGTALAQPAIAPQERVISVVGLGVVYGQPDLATLELGVSATGPDASEVVQRIDEGMRQVLAALDRLGVAEEDIRTTSYNIWREEQFPREEGMGEQAVFRAQHMIAVELAGAERAGEVLTAAVDAGANAVGGITFGFSDPEELESLARVAAVEDAEQQARELAEAAGVVLGEPLRIEEISGAVPPGPFLERAAVMTADAPISAGQLSVEVRVVVAYRIE